MRFSFLVAVEFFFLSIICVGCDACRGIEDVAIDLKTFFSQKDNIINYDAFKLRKDFSSSLLLDADIDINSKLKYEHSLLLCLEEFMYFFRSLFEDKIKEQAGQGELFCSFCQCVAKIINSENIENNDKRGERLYAVLFLNLCKLFFTDNEDENSPERAYKLREDVRDFLIVLKETYNINENEDVGNQGEECFCGKFLDYVRGFFRRFVEEQDVSRLINKEVDVYGLIPDLLKIDEKSFFIVKEESLLGNIGAFPQKREKPKETFFLKNLPAQQVFFKRTKEQCTVLIYGDFVVWASKEKDSKEEKEFVWKRERRNRATPYSFYRLLSEKEIREIDIFAKNPEKKVIDILEDEIMEQMLYDADILCSQISDFILYFKNGDNCFKEIVKKCIDFLKEKYQGDNKSFNDKQKEEIERKINSYFTLQKKGKKYVVGLSDEYVNILNDNELTWEQYCFLSLINEGLRVGIYNIFKEEQDSFLQDQWFKGLENFGNSCYINALSQNLFDYEKEMQAMFKKDSSGIQDFLKIMSNKQGVIGNDKFITEIAGITGYNGTQQDAHELFDEIFIPKQIIKKKPDTTKVCIKGSSKQGKDCGDAYSFFRFYFNSKFECLGAYAFKEKGGEKEMIFKNDFIDGEKKGIKSIHDVLSSIYNYLNKNYDNLSLFYTTTITYCDHKYGGGKDCELKYVIEISPCKDIKVGSCETYNGLNLSSLIKKKQKEKKSVFCEYSKKNVASYTEQAYHNFSDFLVIQLKRFTNNQQSIPNSIPIPDNICFDGDRYDITGILCHSGGTSFGHYFAYKKKFGLWFKFNDSYVSDVGLSLPPEGVKNTYMLFFKKNKEIANKKKKRAQEEEKKKQKRKEIFSVLLQCYSLFKTRYFGDKNERGKTFVEYLQGIVNDIKDTDTLGILELKNKDISVEQFNAFLLLKVQNYYDLSKSIKRIGGKTKKVNETDQEKCTRKELEKLEEDIIKLIYKGKNPVNFYNEEQKIFLLENFVKVFFSSFCDFDTTCFNKLTLESLKNGGVVFFFKKDENFNIPDDRELPFFLITTDITYKQNAGGKDNLEEGGETIPARGATDKYYCFWSDKLIIARDIKKQVKDTSKLNAEKNEINEGNKITIQSSHNVGDAYDSFVNLALFKKTFEEGEYSFFERADDQLHKYCIKNIVGEAWEQREKKLSHLLFFIGKIEAFFDKIKGQIEECTKAINEKNKDFFKEKQEEIVTKYNQQIEEYRRFIVIASKYSEALNRELLNAEKNSTKSLLGQVKRKASILEGLIGQRQESIPKIEDVVKKNENINLQEYKKRLEDYSKYYEKKCKEALAVLRDLKEDITAVLNQKEGYLIKSFNINFADIINVFYPFTFDLFVSNIEEKIKERIIRECQILDFYEYLCFKKQNLKPVLVGSDQRFKGLQNLGNTCYINSILQNLVEIKDDLNPIRDCLQDKGAEQKVTTTHDEVFKVLDANRIGLDNVLTISIANDIFETGDPADIYSFLKNYYIDSTYTIDVVKREDAKQLTYKHLGKDKYATGNVTSYCGQVILLSAWGDTYEKIIDCLYNDPAFKDIIKQCIPLSKGPFVFCNIIKEAYCESCEKKKITIEIQCSPYCLINLHQLQDVGGVNKMSDVVAKFFYTYIKEDQMKGIECDSCKKKSATVNKRSCYKIMNNYLCFNFVVLNRGAKNFIDIEDEVNVGGEVYESVRACYYAPGHYIAFKKINDIWFRFNDANVYPTIYKSLPKMYFGYKPTLVFYKKKKKNKK